MSCHVSSSSEPDDESSVVSLSLIRIDCSLFSSFSFFSSCVLSCFFTPPFCSFPLFASLLLVRCEIKPSHAGFHFVQKNRWPTCKSSYLFVRGHLVKGRNEPCNIRSVPVFSYSLLSRAVCLLVLSLFPFSIGLCRSAFMPVSALCLPLSARQPDFQSASFHARL